MRTIWKALVPLLAAAGALSGCAVAPVGGKCVTAAVLSPASATADHSASAPGNSVQYDVTYQVVSGSGCAVPALAYLPRLTTSDPINITVSADGKATCTGPTNGPATLADTRSGSTAQLTCK